ncbi:TetR/AcrR family transcriptional regulator [Nitriliruptor alkaliphilus]|uniref:TetR/AcrR family transcriptional regulator n=1 Tax=Nitriliruptor alkaliphilus TaxID=427918 RepID=UPI00147014EC|nr:TetR/AcrR family transcriptional regulator [Nitriliruptor alkaliphilus]
MGGAAAAAGGTDGSGEGHGSRVDRRRDATRADILEAASRLAHRDGIAGLSLRDLAAEVGMKAPSLYSYFDSKGAIYDALFAEGYRELDVRIDAVPWDAPVADVLAEGMRTFLTFCVEDLPRYQLMFTRVLPGWEPSADAYAVSVASYEQLVARFAALGITDRSSLDLWTALTAGFAAQQVANDPTGDRWIALVDDAVDLFLTHLEVTR